VRQRHRERSADRHGRRADRPVSPTSAAVTEPSLTDATIVPCGCGPLVTKSVSLIFLLGGGTGPWSPFRRASDGMAPNARAATSQSCPSSCSYRCERSAGVVVVPITAQTTAISSTDATTSGVRSERGARGRERRVRPAGCARLPGSSLLLRTRPSPHFQDAAGLSR
jgi:hypothetical protein